MIHRFVLQVTDHELEVARRSARQTNRQLKALGKRADWTFKTALEAFLGEGCSNQLERMNDEAKEEGPSDH